MATRFGAPRPGQGYATKQRWIVGGLVSVVIVLLVLLVVLKVGTDQGEESATGPEQDPYYTEAVAAVDPNPTVTILVAAQRVEAGSSLMPHMFLEQTIQADRVPEGAILANEKATIAQKFAKKLINANIPLVRDDISDVQTFPEVTRSIPPGYRAVTIDVDRRSGVEGWARPNTRVDILWAYKDHDGNQKVTTIVHFSKILSVGGATAFGAAGAQGQPQQQPTSTTVTLLLKEKDAKKVELARTLGELSLSLVGDNEPGRIAADPDPVTIEDLLPHAQSAPAAEPPPDGVMFTVDPVSGKRVKYILKGHRWTRPEGK